jgi:hypothetical protein
VAGQYDLPRIVVIGDGADITFSGRIGQRLSLGDIGAEQRAHRAHAHRDRRLHRLPAQFQQPRRIGQRERTRRAQRGVFAQAVPGDEIGLTGQRNAAFLFQHPQHRDRIGHDRRLSVFGQGQGIVRPFGHDCR